MVDAKVLKSRSKLSVPCGSDGEEFACNVRDPGSISGLGRFPWRRNGNPLHYSCLENPMDGGVWRATVYGTTKSWTRPKQLTLSFFCLEGSLACILWGLGWTCKSLKVFLDEAHRPVWWKALICGLPLTWVSKNSPWQGIVPFGKTFGPGCWSHMGEEGWWNRLDAGHCPHCLEAVDTVEMASQPEIQEYQPTTHIVV